MKKALTLAMLPFALVPLTMCGSSENPASTNDAGTSSGNASTGSGGSSGASGGGGSGAAAGSGSVTAGSGGTGSSGGGASGNAGSSGASTGSSTGASTGSSATGSSGGASGSSGGTGSSSGAPNGAGASVLMHHNHMNRDGVFVDAKLTKAAAKTMHNDATFVGKITGAAFATPLFVEAGKVPALNGGKGVVFVATEANHVYALDEMTGAVVWDKTVGTPGTPNIPPCCGLAIQPQGVTGTPAIDLATSLIVMDAAQGPGLGDHIVYGLDLATGATKVKVSLSGVKDSKGRTFSPTDHLQRTAVLIVPGATAATTFAYFAYAGNIGDAGAYFGWVIGVPLDGTAANIKAWRTDATHAGIWGPGGPSSDGSHVFITTGNAPGGSAWGGQESVIKLGLDLTFTGTNTDYFTPSDFRNLDSNDIDISGSGPVVLDAPGMAKKLVLALGKDGKAYLIDPANMGGMGGTILATTTVSHGAISNAAAWASIGGTVYVVANNNWTQGSGCALGGMDKNGGNNQNDNLFMFTIGASNTITEVWCGNSGGHTSPIITTSDGTNDAIVWIGGGSSGNGGPGDNKLHAFDLLSGVEISNTASVAGMATLSSSLMAAHGRIYAASTQGSVYAITP